MKFSVAGVCMSFICDGTGIRNRDLVGPIPESDSWFLIPAGIPEFGYPGVLAQYPTGQPEAQVLPLGTSHLSLGSVTVATHWHRDWQPTSAR